MSTRYLSFKSSLLFSACILVFLLPLFNAWLLYPTNKEAAITIYAAAAGLFPWSDAAVYYHGAEQLLSEGSLTSFTLRRPLNAILLAVRLWITQDFKYALVLQAIFCALASLMMTLSISQQFGKRSGLITFGILFLFASVFLPTTLTETLGLTLGALGFVLFWEAVQQKKGELFFAAGCMLMIAQNTRAGALFIFPFLLLWIAIILKNKRALLLFSLGVVVAIFYSILLSKLYSTGTEAATHANFSYVLFGLVSGGKTWNHANIIYPHLSAQSENQIATFLYRESLNVFLNNPFLLLLGFLRGLGGAIKGMINFKTAIHTINSCFFILSFYRLYQLRQDYRKEVTLVGTVLLAMLVSAGVIWVDGGMRVYAATVPFFAVAMGMAWHRKKPLLQATPQIFTSQGALVLSSILVLSAFIPKFIPKHHIPHTTLICPPHHSAALIYNLAGAPHLNLVENKQAFEKAITKSTIEDKESFMQFLKVKNLKNTPILSLGYDQKQKNLQYFLSNADVLDKKNDYTTLCIPTLGGAK